MLSADNLVILQHNQHLAALDMDKVLDLSHWITSFATAMNPQSLNANVIRGIPTIAAIKKMLVLYVQVRVTDNSLYVCMVYQYTVKYSILSLSMY